MDSSAARLDQIDIPDVKNRVLATRRGGLLNGTRLRAAQLDA
jgi:hypothetical protein